MRDPLTGQCKPDPCKSKARQTATEGYFDIGTDPAGRVPTTGCYDGCLAIFSGQSPAGEADVGGVKHYFAKGSYEYNGMSCSSSDSSGSPGSAKPGDTAGNGGGGGDGSGDGEDNGEGDDDTGGDDEGGEDDTGTGGGGDNGDDEGEDDEGDERSAGGGCGSFYCSGDAIDCAIARSNYELLCLEQKKKYTDTNDCASAPVCDGDPILCATALTAFKQRCQMKWAETQNEFSDEFLTAKAQFDSKNVPELIKEQDASEWFKLGTHVSGSVQCPADFVVPVFGHEVSVPTSFLCQYLVIIALVLKTLAWLFVGRLIFGEL